MLRFADDPSDIGVEGVNFSIPPLKLLMASLVREKDSVENVDGSSSPLSSISPLPLAKVVALGVDTWSLCWYGKPGSPLLSALRSLATIQAGRAYLVPMRAAGHRVGWFPEHGLVFAEGHPIASGLCSPSEIPSAAARLTEHLHHIGLPLPCSEPAKLRRLDVAVDVSMSTPAVGLTLLDCLGRESFGSGKVVTYRHRHRVQTVILKSPAGRSQARIYDKGTTLGTEYPGQLLRFEAQWRFGNGFRPYLETLDASSLRHRFNSRFARVREAAVVFQLDGLSDLTHRLHRAVINGSLPPSRARSLAGYLLLTSVGVDQGASRTRCELDRQCRALGISTSLISPPFTDRFDAAQLFDECMAVDTWLCE